MRAKRVTKPMNLTLHFSPAQLARVKRMAAEERKTVAAFLRDRLAAEGPLNLDPLRMLVSLIEARAAAGRLRPEDLKGFRDLSALIGETLALLPPEPVTAKARPA